MDPRLKAILDAAAKATAEADAEGERRNLSRKLNQEAQPVLRLTGVPLELCPKRIQQTPVPALNPEERAGEEWTHAISKHLKG